LKFLDYAPVVFLSAKTGDGVNQLYKLIREAHGSAGRRIPTGELNRFVASLRLKSERFTTSPGFGAPADLHRVHRRAGPLHFSHERHLINQLRRRLGLKQRPSS